MEEKKAPSFLFSAYGDLFGEMKFLNDVKNSDRSPEEKQRVMADMKAVGKKYGFTYREYMLYGFEHLTPEQQHAFISDKERLDIVMRMNPDSVRDVLNNKFETYRRFSKYFKRDVALILPGERDKFKEFLAAHKGAITKSFGEYGGYGERVIRADDPATPDALADEVFARYKDGFVIEELLVNAPEIRAIYPKALNTCRIPAIKNGDEVRIFHPVLRIGRGGAEIDSATAAGGIMAVVDVETGELLAACDESLNRYEKHPDTGAQIVGFKIPRWDEAIALVKEIATVLEGQHYAGWDLALTPDGWKMIEGNACGMFIWQMPMNRGFRAELEQICADLNFTY